MRCGEFEWCRPLYGTTSRLYALLIAGIFFLRWFRLIMWAGGEEWVVVDICGPLDGLQGHTAKHYQVRASSIEHPRAQPVWRDTQTDWWTPPPSQTACHDKERGDKDGTRSLREWFQEQMTYRQTRLRAIIKSIKKMIFMNFLISILSFTYQWEICSTYFNTH